MTSMRHLDLAPFQRVLATLGLLAMTQGCWAQSPSSATAAAPPLTVHAAGSLRAVMGSLAQAFQLAHPGGSTPRLVLGASGLLRDRLAAGEPSQVFASANMAHPESLVKDGKANRVDAFARNALCALAAPDFSLQGRTLAQRLLDDSVRVATSTPRADPSGDYAFEMFERIEATGSGPAGSAQALKAKALQLTGGPQSPPPPSDRNVYGALMAEGRADVFITYCTNAAQAQREVRALQVLDIPDAINVSARYGITRILPVTDSANAFVDFVLSPAGQRILGEHGFKAP
jgi:molybdate transport system substrate-binding protein